MNNHPIVLILNPSRPFHSADFKAFYVSRGVEATEFFTLHAVLKPWLQKWRMCFFYTQQVLHLFLPADRDDRFPTVPGLRFLGFLMMKQFSPKSFLCMNFNSIPSLKPRVRPWTYAIYPKGKACFPSTNFWGKLAVSSHEDWRRWPLWNFMVGFTRSKVSCSRILLKMVKNNWVFRIDSKIIWTNLGFRPLGCFPTFPQYFWIPGDEAFGTPECLLRTCFGVQTPAHKAFGSLGLKGFWSQTETTIEMFFRWFFSMIWHFIAEVFLFLSLLLVGSTRHCADVGLCSVVFCGGKVLWCFFDGGKFFVWDTWERDPRPNLSFLSNKNRIRSLLGFWMDSWKKLFLLGWMMNDFGCINTSRNSIPEPGPAVWLSRLSCFIFHWFWGLWE